MNHENQAVEQTQNGRSQCPESCCMEGDILCVSIPCPINIVLLGIDLELTLPCLRLSSSTDISATEVNTLLQTLSSLLSNLSVPTQQ